MNCPYYKDDTEVLLKITRTYAQDQRNRVSGPDFGDEIEIYRS